MKKLPDTIHVEALTAAHGEEIIQTFKKLGISTNGMTGSNTKEDNDFQRYYGLRDRVFDAWDISKVSHLVTLNQLKGYLDVEIPELPIGL